MTHETGSVRGLRRAVFTRQGGRCAVTGALLGDPDGDTWHMHHRRPGGRGGTSRTNQHRLGNVVGLLARVHNFGAPGLLLDGVDGRSVHGDPAWSKPLGLLLSSHEAEPSAVPVRTVWGWVFLGDDGSVTPVV